MMGLPRLDLMPIRLTVSTRPTWSQSMQAVCIHDIDVDKRMNQIAQAELRRFGLQPLTITASDDHGHKSVLHCDIEALFWFEYA